MENTIDIKLPAIPPLPAPIGSAARPEPELIYTTADASKATTPECCKSAGLFDKRLPLFRCPVCKVRRTQAQPNDEDEP
jgi:hypothetical protein